MNNDSMNGSMLPPPRAARSSRGMGCGMAFLIVALLGSAFLNVVLCAGLFAATVGNMPGIDAHLSEKFHSGARAATDKVAVVEAVFVPGELTTQRKMAPSSREEGRKL